MNWLMDTNPTVIAALVAAVAAIVAPIITSWINNRHQYKMRKLEIMQTERIRVIQHYAEACSNYISRPNQSELVEYSKSYGKIFLYAPKAIHKDIEEIQRLLDVNDFSSASSLLVKVCQELSSEMKV